ncbi:hypothetical protein [Nonomuraea sp. B5E05]|uniref:hypothetical protein n=1 Tax=Nonomuraea sp. B5E05 TaxID=3153569 RepID=UPI003260EB6A
MDDHTDEFPGMPLEVAGGKMNAMYGRELPVPSVLGDRQLDGRRLADYIVERIEAEDLTHARLLLHLAGARCASIELPIILERLREASLRMAAEAVLFHVGERVTSDVLRIVKQLIEAKLYDDAALVLRIAVPE